MNDRHIFREALREKGRILYRWQRKYQTTIAKNQCKRGCAACCYQMVGASFFEGYAIAKYVLEKLPWLEQAIYTQHTQLDDLGLGTGVWHHKIKTNDIGRFLAKYFEEHISCVFLSRKRDCLIYSHRPITCASYFALSSPELCAGPVGTNVILANNAEPVAASLNIDQDVLSAVTGSKYVLALPMLLVDAVAAGLIYIRHGLQGLEARYVWGGDSHKTLGCKEI